jgi:hypothetical protein
MTEEHSKQIVDIPDDGIKWEKPVKKRKRRVTSFIICFMTAAGIIAYASLVETTVIHYHADNDNSTITLKTGTITCYTRKEKTTYPVFFNLGLGLMGIILGTVDDRLSLFIEELFQLQTRYNGEYSKAFKACFNGISWYAVAVVFAFVVISCYVGRKTPYKLADIIFILGGIGVGPLIIHLLNLNTESDVDVSRMLEEKQMYPGYTLAWSYYFNHLKPAVEILNDPKKNLKSTTSDARQEGMKLSLNKLLLLLPPSTDIADIDTLISKDETIENISVNNDQNPYTFPLYWFKEHGKKYYTMKCVKEPIVALREMRGSSDVHFVTDETYNDEVKRFYGTLCEILNNPNFDGYTKKGLVVPIAVKPGEDEYLKDGGLAKFIIAKLDHAPPPQNSGEDASDERPLLDNERDPSVGGASTSRLGRVL